MPMYFVRYAANGDTAPGALVTASSSQEAFDLWCIKQKAEIANDTDEICSYVFVYEMPSISAVPIVHDWPWPQKAETMFKIRIP
jgi:hypothetical protein